MLYGCCIYVWPITSYNYNHYEIGAVSQLMCVIIPCSYLTALHNPNGTRSNSWLDAGS